MKTLFIILLSILAIDSFKNSDYQLYVNDALQGDLTSVEAIPYPQQIKVVSEHNVKVEVTLIARGRKLMSVSMRTNETQAIRSFKGVNKIHVKVHDKEKPFVEYLDIEKEN